LPMSSTQKSKGIIVVISGPSGVGKGTICKELVKRLDDACLSVSVTTRPRTPKEVEGKDYWFVSRDEFGRRIENGLLLEHAEVFGNFYGTPKDKVDAGVAAGKVVILEIDVQGCKQIKKLYPDTVMVFILAPTDKELAGRLRGRGRDDEETAKRRLEQASNEIAVALQDYQYMVTNDKLDLAVSEIIGIIETARKAKKK
jgi:guanylate kinase